MWRKKKTLAEKQAGREQARKRQKFLQPHRSQFKSEGAVNEYCDVRKLSERVRVVMIKAVRHNRPVPLEMVDYRKVPKEDRVPRSMQCPDTPPGYWDLRDP